MSSYFYTKDGRVFTPAERKASAAKSKAARARGEIAEVTECNRCGQTQGIIQSHNHDYAHHYNYLEHLCWRCHMIYHSDHFAPKQCDAYWETVAAGVRWPPVYRSDFAILERDHGIKHPGRGTQARAMKAADSAAERFKQPDTWGPVPGGYGTARRLALVMETIPHDAVEVEPEQLELGGHEE